MFDKFYRALAELEQLRLFTYEVEYRLGKMDIEHKSIQEITRLSIEATEDIYEERRQSMHKHIHKLTLDQWESMRFMNTEQFDAFKRRNI